MKKSKPLYHGYRFPAGVISCAVRWYFRFQLSLRDIEDLLFERGVIVTYETIRCWCDKFGANFAHRVKATPRGPASTWHLDEMFATLRGEPYLLWRAIDEHGAAFVTENARKPFCRALVRSDSILRSSGICCVPRCIENNSANALPRGRFPELTQNPSNGF